MSDTHGTIYWSELLTRDVDAARSYFEKVAGWTFTTVQMPEGPCHIATIGEKTITSIMDLSLHPEMDQSESRWFVSVAVDDVDATAAQTRELGGRVIREPFDVPGTARIAVVADPAGGVFGLVTPLS